jgi:hypothetical protein
VITDGIIADTGQLNLQNSTGLRIVNTAANTLSQVFIGIDDDSEGWLYLYGDNASVGGRIYLHAGADEDGNGTQHYSIQVSGDDLVIGADNDWDMLKFLGGATPTIQSTVAFDVDAALSATTVDADTDFTVGSLVLTDDKITGGTIELSAIYTTITNTTPGNGGNLRLGVDLADRGFLKLYGAGAATTVGGEIQLYVGDDFDDPLFHYSIKANGLDLRIGPNIDDDALHYDGTLDEWHFVRPVDVDAALTAATVDADTDFTVGGTVITDGNINDTGWLNLVGVNGVQILGSGALNVGQIADQYGAINVYGDKTGSATGGILTIYTADDFDDPTNYFRIQATSDNLTIGSDDDSDMLTFLDSTSIQSTVPFDVDAALSATTVDADTDFTVGGTVITDGAITDNGIFNIDAVTSVDIEGAGRINVGTADSVRGRIDIFGPSGDAAGGQLLIYNSASNDDTQDYYILQTAVDESLQIGSAGNVDMLKFLIDGTIKSTVAFDVDAALTATTVDADTDFTVGGTVLTDAKLQDDGILVLNGSVGGVSLQHEGGEIFHTTANGGIFTNKVAASDCVLAIGKDDEQTGKIYLYGDTDSDTNGGSVRMYTAKDYDSDIDYYFIDSYQDDLRIGSDTNITAFVLKATGAVVEAQFDCKVLIGGGGLTFEPNKISTNATLTIEGTSETLASFTDDGAVKLYHNNAVVLETGTNGVDINNRVTGTDAILRVGTDHAERGKIYLFGDHSGGLDSGGELRLYNSADHDGSIDYYRIFTDEDDLRIGPNTNTDALKYNGGGNRWDSDAHFYPRSDSSFSLGSTSLRWANVWADNYGGGDFSMLNGWRMLESDKYEDYPEGFALGYEGFKEGVVTEKMPKDIKPFFAVTKEFIEYAGIRITPKQFKKLLDLVK